MNAEQIQKESEASCQASQDNRLAGSSADRALERMTRLAARSLNVSIVLFALMDGERMRCVWFGPRSGDIPGKIALNSSGILRPEPLIILDSAADQRSTDHPLLQALPGLRFCASYPLKTASDDLIGVLCVAGPQPRAAFGPDDLATLHDLAALAQNQLDLHAVTNPPAPRSEQKTAPGLHTGEACLLESESKYRSIVNNLKEVVFQTDREGHWTFLNPAWTEITGFELVESIGCDCLSFIFAEDRAICAAAFQRLIDQSEPSARHNLRCITKNDGFRWIKIHAQPMLADDQTVAGVVGTIADITERKQAQALAAGQKHLLELMTLGAPVANVLESLVQMIQEQAPGTLGAVLLLDDDGEALRHIAGSSLAPAFIEAIDGMPIGSRSGSHGRAVYFGETVIIIDIAVDPRWTANRELALQHQIRACWSLPILSTQGEILGTFVMFSRVPRPPSEQERQLMHVATNIAAFAIEPKRVEQELRESEDRYRIVAETASDAIMTIDESGTILFANQAAKRIFGYTRNELINQNMLLLMPDHLCAQYWKTIREYLNGWRDRPWKPIEFFGLHKSGALIPLELSFGEFSKLGKRHFTTIVRDITQRKQAEEELQNAYARLQKLSDELRRGRDLLRTLFDNLGDGLVLLDHEGVALAVNQAMANFLSSMPDQIVGRSWAALCAESQWRPGQIVLQTLQDGRSRSKRIEWLTAENEHRILDVQTLPLNGSGALERVILHVADVTDRVQVETLAIQNERLAANGKLAAAMAHEINTPLQSIRSCLYLATKAVNGERAKYLQVAREEIDRISGILRNLLDLHRPNTGEETLVDLNALVERVLLLTGSTLADRGIEVVQDLAPDLPSLRGRIDQLTQVLLNLTLNAIEAMPHGGQLRFTTREECRHHAGAPSALVLEIADTGCGMSEEIQQQIFEPFFTSKSHGSGLGLAISHAIVTQHGGQILVHSTPQVGSTFTLLFMLDTAATAEAKER